MRQFVSATMPDKKGRLSLSAKERRYLVSVLRLSEGDSVDVRLPNGILCAMKIHFCSGDIRGTTIVELLVADNAPFTDNIDEVLCQSGIQFWLFQFLPKGQKMDLIVRQATECGVAVIVPIMGEYSVGAKDVANVSSGAKRLERWERIIREAQQQSGSPVATKVMAALNPEQAITLWQNGITNIASVPQENKSLAFMLRERQEEQDGLYSVLRKNADGLLHGRVALAVGCEGGISFSEICLFEENGFMPIHFKTNILRAETAALYGLAALQTAIMEYESWMMLNE